MANKLLKSLNFGGSDTYYVGWSSIQDAPFGIDYSSGETIVENKTYTYDAEGGGYALDFTIEPNCGYKVVVNGTEYEYTSQTLVQDLGTIYWIGNGGPMDMGIEDNGEPLVITTMDMSAIGYGIMNMMVFVDGSTNDVSLTVIKYTKINKLPSAYYDKVEPTYFYIKDDKNDTDVYLYKDLGCTEKATQDDVNNAMKKGIMYVCLGGLFTFIVIGVQKSIELPYIGVYFQVLGDFRNKYTAEYTAS